MPLCERHPDDFAEHDEQFDPAAVRRALDTCRTCKLVDTATFDSCAAAAITAGTTFDGVVKACASGVVQAGIVCRADVNTWRRLRRAANPDRDHRQHCTICNRRFGVEATPDHSGMCSGCIQAYRINGIPSASTRRNTPPAMCVTCSTPMVTYAGPRPDGTVRHAAHGECKRCHRRNQRNAA